jgi:Uma2 family endonuclease
VVSHTPPIPGLTAAPDDAYLRTYYGCTPEDWEQFASANRFVEFIDGRVIVHSPAGLAHQRLFGFLHHLLRGYVEARRSGEILTGPFTMELALERKFEPDIMYVSQRTAASLDEDRLRGPADLAIEIASPSTRAYDQGEKRDCYRVGGVREYWMVDPANRVIVIDRPAGREVTRVSVDRVMSELLPGFWLRAEWLWADPLPAVATCLNEVLGGGAAS